VSAAAQAETNGFSSIEVERLVPSVYQARTDIDDKELTELKNSIKENGIIQPLIVRKYGEKYEVVAGSRRYYAAKELGIKTLPAIVKELDDKNALVFSILENLQRQDLNPMEEAESFKRLIEEFKVSQDEAATMLSKDRSTIANHLRLFQLPQKIQQSLRERKIAMSHARTLLSLPTESEQLALFEKILTENLSVRKVEAAVKDKTRDIFAKKEKKENTHTKALENDLQRILARKVHIASSDGKKGKLSLEFYSPSDLERLIKLLTAQKGASA
jgi:ParB family chromosome partitioning protein